MYLSELEKDLAVRQYKPMVCKLARKVFPNVRYDFEDLVQEGLCGVLEGVESYENSRGTTMSAWVYRVVYYRLMNYKNRNKHAVSGAMYANGVLSKYDWDPEKVLASDESQRTKMTVLAIVHGEASFDDDENPVDVADTDAGPDYQKFNWRDYLNDEDEVRCISYKYEMGLSFRDMEKCSDHTHKYWEAKHRAALMHLREDAPCADYFFD